MPSGTPVAGSIFFPDRAKMRRRSQGKKRYDFDAVECLCSFLPFVPRHPVHVWNWGRDETTGHAFSARRETYYSYRSMPIRWSPGLLARALLRYWLWVPILVSLPFSLSLAHSAGFKVAAFIVLLKERRYCEAMWAARLCLAVEDERQGRLLTEDVLYHRDVPAILARIKVHPKRFNEIVSFQHPQPFPLLRQEKSRAAAYWHSMVSDPTKEVYTMVT
jgi:hypothetical protein